MMTEETTLPRDTLGTLRKKQQQQQHGKNNEPIEKTNYQKHPHSHFINISLFLSLSHFRLIKQEKKTITSKLLRKMPWISYIQ